MGVHEQEIISSVTVQLGTLLAPWNRVQARQHGSALPGHLGLKMMFDLNSLDFFKSPIFLSFVGTESSKQTNYL